MLSLMRTLRLNCVTRRLRRSLARLSTGTHLQSDQWAGGSTTCQPSRSGRQSPESGPPTLRLRIADDRRQALVEIDALVALVLGVTADQLCTIYRTQFPVLYGYDRNDYVYDANGRLVPDEVLSVWRTKGDNITGDERTATNQAGHTYIYELPFRLLDREADMRTAYAEFERRLAAL